MREILPIGTIVPINGKDYRIEGLIGEGASCVVYDASAENEFGAIRKYRLKECYPHNVTCHREGEELIWEDATQQAEVFTRFKKSINVLSALRDERSLGNYFTEPEPYEANGSLYAVMPVNHAKTYDKDRSNDLHQILKTVLKLARIVDRLHSYGYLHLDIKPENFLVEYDPDPNIWLFDVDSLIPISDLQKGRITCYSYSKEWAAPELVQAKLNRVSPATDLYSIGAILFNKVMGHPVSNDDIGLFAEWDFDGELFDAVNPKVQRYLSEIFKKTLSATVKCRYQQAHELVSALEQALDVLRKPYLLSNIPDNSCGFVGREQEISEIQRAFAENKHIVFLTGIGGIGKSELAKRFGNLHKKRYDAVIYATFYGSIEELLLDVEIQDFDGNEKQQNRQLNRLLDKDILLIIDNMDAEDAPGLERLSKLKCDILITSRLEWQEYSFPTIKVGSLSLEEQFSLFLYECGGVMNLNQRQAVFSILSAIEGYTLLIPLIAKQVRKGSSSIEEIADKVQIAGIKAASSGKVRHLKDGTALSGSVYRILSEVLNMAEFSENERYVMRSMALLSRYRIHRNEFVRWIGKEYDDSIEELIFRSWIQCGKYRGNLELSLHAIIANVCFEELMPSMVNCHGIRNRIFHFVSDFASWHKNPTSYYFGGYAPTHIKANTQYQLDSYVQMMNNILLRCDWADPDNIVFWIVAIEAVTNVIDGDFTVFEDFLEHVLGMSLRAIEEYGEIFPRSSYAAVAMEAIYLQKNDLGKALIAAVHVVETLQGEEQQVDILFRMCFHFYQWLCLRWLDFEDYWNISGFYEMAEFIKQQWQQLLEAEVIGFEDNEICVLGNEHEDDDTGVEEAVNKAFQDYCYKISPAGIQKAKDIVYDSLEDISDLLAAAEKATDKAWDISGLDIPRSTYVDTGETLSDEELELSRFVRTQQEHVNSMLRCKVENPMGIWLVMKPRIWSAQEKHELRNQLLQMDSMMQVHIPSVDGRTVFAYELAKMEAAFSYAYAVVEDWGAYHFHKRNLLAYYKILIHGKRFLKYLKTSTINEITTGLPGLASLLNKYGTVLPDERALQLLSDVIELMEQYHISEKLPADSLFEVYKMALNYAEKAKDTSAIIHFQTRVNRLSSVYFSEKE